MGANTNTKAIGLNTQPNELDAPPGSLAVCENMVISRDGVIELDRGFEDYSANLPDFTPSQLISIGGVAYLHLDGGLWYFDGSNWRRKRGAFGAKSSTPSYAWVNQASNILYYTDAVSNVVGSINLTTGATGVLAGRFGAAGALTDGTGDAARFNGPAGIYGDGAGNLYVGDATNYAIRKIVIATGVVTTLAGNGAIGTADGTGAGARFTAISGVWCDATNIYITDGSAVRKIVIASGVVTTFAGSITLTGTTDDTGTLARFGSIAGLWGDGSQLYVNDTRTIRKVTYPGAVVTTVAGNSGAAGSADGTGAAARFATNLAMVGDGNGSLYLVDGTRIRKMTYPGYVVSSLFGTYSVTGTADGIGTAALFTSLGGLAIADSGASLFACDSVAKLIKKCYIATAYAATIAGIVSSGMPSTPSTSPYADGIVVGPS